MESFRDEHCDFTGEPGKTDDQVDAMIHLVRYAITAGAGGALPSGWTTPEQVNEKMSDRNAIGNINEVINPFGETCGFCKFYEKRDHLCRRHSRRVSSIDTCPDHKSSVEAVPTPFYIDLAGLRIIG
jgi:hypothetical protein